MAKKLLHRKTSIRRAACESVHFEEVEFNRPVIPRLVIRFSEGLSVLVEDQSCVALAADFIVAFRESEQKGGSR